MRQEKKSVLSKGRLRASGKRLTVLTAAATMLTALFWSGCAIQRRTTPQSGAARNTEAMAEEVRGAVRTDSVVRMAVDSASEVVEVRTEGVSVPKSSVTLRIATDSLLSLPGGASYSGQSGQAGVKVTRGAATASGPEYIYVYATCDSLALECERYERTVRSLHMDYGEQLSGLKIRLAETSQELHELEEKPPDGVGTSFKWFLYGILGGFLIARIKNIISIIKKVTRL